MENLQFFVVDLQNKFLKYKEQRWEKNLSSENFHRKPNRRYFLH
jgi:hypothetical protein